MWLKKLLNSEKNSAIMIEMSCNWLTSVIMIEMSRNWLTQNPHLLTLKSGHFWDAKKMGLKNHEKYIAPLYEKSLP